MKKSLLDYLVEKSPYWIPLWLDKLFIFVFFVACSFLTLSLQNFIACWMFGSVFDWLFTFKIWVWGWAIVLNMLFVYLSCSYLRNILFGKRY